MSIVEQVWIGLALGFLGVICIFLLGILNIMISIKDTLLAIKEIQEIDPQFRRY